MAEEKNKQEKNKKKEKKDTKKTEQESKKQEPLTEWQKRNVEFLQKQKERQEDEKRELEKQRELLEKIGAIPSTTPKTGDDDKDEEKEAKVDKPPLSERVLKRVRKIRPPKLSFKKILSAFKRPAFKASVVLVVSTLVILLSLYFITPLGSTKELSVSGNTSVSQDDILKASQIKSSDYTLAVAMNEAQIASRVKASAPWIQTVNVTFSWPNRFQIQVDDYSVFGYHQSGDGYVPVYENGAKGTSISASNLPSQYLTINLDNENQIQELVRQMRKISTQLRENIQTVDLASSAATADLLRLTMRDGNTVLVPLSQLGTKLPYYTRISSSLTAPITVDMEVGIYTTTGESSSSSDTSSTEAASSQDQTSTETTTTEGTVPTETTDQTTQTSDQTSADANSAQ